MSAGALLLLLFSTERKWLAKRVIRLTLPRGLPLCARDALGKANNKLYAGRTHPLRPRQKPHWKRIGIVMLYRKQNYTDRSCKLKYIESTVFAQHPQLTNLTALQLPRFEHLSVLLPDFL
ncbi:hypothetical protein Zmor_028495 [Zophobas morio]|uniref:Secreted protein n=1 Tax=Zophobas morio TaxID=2755281 RepID=A0AA38HJ91_9CUCU|nr:hypothetical protein Zmor_028495 [Zophobas morio]